jgi:hypothetical protein
MILIEATELRMQKAVFNSNFEKRMKEFTDRVLTKKPHWTKFPQQQYACCYPMMRKYIEDIISLTCKDCISNGVAITDCRTCKSQCQTDIFLEEDIITMATDKLQNDELKACKHVPNKHEDAHQNFAEILLSSVRKGFESLSKSKSVLDEKNALSAAAGHMSWQHMPSKEELHSLQ